MMGAVRGFRKAVGAHLIFCREAAASLSEGLACRRPTLDLSISQSSSTPPGFRRRCAQDSLDATPMGLDFDGRLCQGSPA